MEDPVSAVKPVGRARLVDTVVDHLRTLILCGDLPPGQTLLQIELSQRLGVSRTPLREAFRILEHEGLVRVSNGNKTLEVVDLSVKDMLELYEIREVVDGLAARLAAKHRDESRFDELASILREMNLADMANDVPRRTTLHADFHAAIAELSGNKHVIAQVPMIRLTAQMLSHKMRTMRIELPTVRAELIEQGEQDHREILEALRSGDERRAENAARRHIRKTMRSELLKPDRHVEYSMPEEAAG
ncbi:GntR family transcriptional regulator [Nocardia sp. alder85J]|uniref:GntR family transcriptional regulator n=1 Tax=Nocardia sp. alder85J TaxID=2862949 RepID=UPI001CD304C4|nr:GntR family transcriptional regulator [Nocardia sp. alder85J]MCX4095635.1 GntR family transcriptional regulator [Nocardia sp. alder85J]